MANSLKWKCSRCGLFNSSNKANCIACFSNQPIQTQTDSQITKHELLLLIAGFVRCKTLSSHQILPCEIIQSISLYYWPILYDQFNAFKFKNNDKQSRFLQYLIIPMQELKSKYLLPFNKNTNLKTAKYSGINSKYCPSFLKPNQCPIFEVTLDKNNENIYHFMDSFIQNKFIQLFPDIESEYHLSFNNYMSDSTDILLPKGKGPYRSGFRCLGQPTQQNKLSILHFNHRKKCRKVWKFIGGNFELLQLTKHDFNHKCLFKRFGIDLKMDSINDKYLINLLYIGLINPMVNRTPILGLADVCELRMNGCYNPQIIAFLNCEQIMCAALYDIAAPELSKQHWITQIFIEWKEKLNLESALINANTQLRACESFSQQMMEEPLHCSSWKEIEVIDNDIKNDLYPFLLSEIIFSNTYGEGKSSIRSVGSEDWDKQREIFGNMFLKLFENNEKNNKIRAFWETNIGWDLFGESYLSADRILCCVDNEKIMAVWSLFARFGI